MGCTSSKSRDPTQAQCCCPCCGCCIVPPKSMVLYDDLDDHQLPKQSQLFNNSSVTSSQPLACLATRHLMAKDPDADLGSCSGSGGTSSGAAHGHDADPGSAPTAPDTSVRASHTAARWTLPNPANWAGNLCMNMGMNNRSLKTLAAHLNAKGFYVGTQPDAVASPAPVHTPAARWHSVASNMSGFTPTVTPAAGSPHAAPDLSALSNLTWAWHDASSQAGPHSPHGSDHSAASDAAWRDVIEEGRSEGGRGDVTDGSVSDVSSEVSHNTASPRSTRCTHSTPRPVRPLPCMRPGSASRSGSGVGKGARSPPSWETSVHLAQASVAAEDLAHPQGKEAHPALQAFIKGQLSFAFSGGGFFFPYHLGCVIALKDMGIITDATPLAGASCGSIIVACVNSGLDLHKLVNRLLEFADDCRTYGTAGRLKDVIVKFMTANLPPDGHLRCRNRTYISLTKVFPYLHPYIIADYTSKEDLVHAIATSCHIPAYNDGSFMARFRNHWFVDGGLCRHIPALPAEAGAAHVAGISCVPFKFLESLPGVSRLQLLHSLAVSPDMFGSFPFGWHEVGGLVLAPAADPVLLQMVDMGKRDIAAWASAVGLTSHLESKRAIRPPLKPASTLPDDSRPRRTGVKRRVKQAVTGPAAAGDGRAAVAGAESGLHVDAISAEEPGGLPAEVEDDWHDAVEDQGLMTSAASPSASQQAEVGEEVAEAAVRDRLAAAAGAVAGPLHMAADQAVDVLAGTSTLGMAHAAVAGPGGTSHSHDPALFQLLGVQGGRCRAVASHPGPDSMPCIDSSRPPLSERTLAHAPAQLAAHSSPQPVAATSSDSVGQGQEVESQLGPHAGSPGAEHQVVRLDIDVDPSQWAVGGCDSAAQARAAGATGAGAADAEVSAGVGAAASDVRQHTVQVTARVAGQPVVLELCLHLPALDPHGAALTADRL